jgi:predicted transposase YbfD/YdcC
LLRLTQQDWHGGSKRTINRTTSTEYPYYLLNLENNVHKFAESVRNHWSIENQLHWVLDVGFNEDNSQCYRGYGVENLAVIRHIGSNLLSKDKKTTVGVKAKRLKASWNSTDLKITLEAFNIVIA